MRPLAPTYTAHLLDPIHRELVALLHSLSPSQWLSPTSAGQWRVRDVVAHVLDGDIRRLSYHRDGLRQPELATLRTYDDLVAHLNELNNAWVAVADRFSPRLLTQLVDDVGRQAVDFLANLPPHEAAQWPVAWAGEGRSENWMDVSRNYTEYWHHQQQIREAVGKPLLNDPRWLQPVVALGVRAIPPALRHADAAAGTIIHINVTGPAGGRWWLRYAGGDWALSQELPASRVVADATIEVDAETAARIWYAARGPQAAAARAQISGDAGLAEAVLMARAVMV